MKNLVKRFLVITLISLSAMVLFIAHEQGLNLEVILVLVSAGTLVLAFILEKKIPFRDTWNNNIGDLKTDISSALTLVILVEPVIKALLPLLIIALYQSVNAQYS